MGTRGVFGFKVDGKNKLSFSANDSYYDSLGKHMEHCLRHALKYHSIDDIADNIRLMTACEFSEDSKDDFMDIESILDAMIGKKSKYVDASEFQQDTLFCQCLNIINFDLGIFQSIRLGSIEKEARLCEYLSH
jgi:hypothetical protein